MRLLVLVPMLLLGAPVSLRGQEVASPRMDGQVVLGVPDSVGAPVVAAAGAEVVLHHITLDTAGEIDTVFADEQGRFGFDLPVVPDPLVRGDVYFASVRHAGVLYFGPPVHEAVQLDSLYRVQVFDTVMAPEGGAPLPVLLRYLMLDPGDSTWVVTDVFQVENASDQTLVRPEGEAVWRYPLASGATELEVVSGDAGPGAVRLQDGLLEVTAPVSPGVREYAVRYVLPQPRLDVPLPGTVGQVEFLVEEPAPPLAVQGLAANEPELLASGITLRRFTGLNLQDQRVLVTPGDESGRFPVEWLAIVMAMVLAAVALRTAMRAPPTVAAVAGAPAPGPGAGPSVPERRDRLLLEVADIDERLEASSLPEAERARLARRRGELLEALRALA